MISLIESAGADRPNQSKLFVPGGRGLQEDRAPPVATAHVHFMINRETT